MKNLPSMLNNGLKKTNNWITKSPSETLELGRALAKKVKKGVPLCISGDLGAGKTTLIKGIASYLTGISPLEVNSPTFSYLNIYEGFKTLYHFDLYRIDGCDEFMSLGFDEYLSHICCVEWGEKIEALLPKNCVFLKLKYLSLEKRIISYEF